MALSMRRRIAMTQTRECTMKMLGRVSELTRGPEIPGWLEDEGNPKPGSNFPEG